eukprot:TRINITY_DN22756_c0_g1_i1.p1 TRINITY_DN22756_c0_g1~~TRINITY_DN22756_c0_g1_i1.p1  ORF type:complete len:540 (+),score=68.37 TRINITY_DN22756_c0_g1_i1:80-1699(+)
MASTPEHSFTFQDLLLMLAEEHKSAMARLQAQISGPHLPSLPGVVTDEFPDGSPPSGDNKRVSFLGSDSDHFSGIVPEQNVKKHVSYSEFVSEVSIEAVTRHVEEDEEESVQSPDFRLPRSPSKEVDIRGSVLKSDVWSAPPDPGGSPAIVRVGPDPRETWNRQVSVESSVCGEQDGRITSKMRAMAVQFDEVRATSELVATIRTFLESSQSSQAAFWWAKFWILLILTSACMPLMQMMLVLPRGEVALHALDITFELCFLAELTVRLATCRRIIAFIRSPYFVLDFVAFLPLVLRLAVGNSSSVEENPVQLGLLLLTPTLRLLKFMRPFSFLFNIFGEVVNQTKGALVFLLLWLLILVLVASSSLYVVEPRSNLEDYRRCMWLSLVTMTTVGYGDETPETPAGELIVMALMVVSFLFLAIPVGILGNAFTHVWADRDRLTIVWKASEMMNDRGMKYRDVPGFFKQFDLTEDGSIGLHEFRLMNQEMQTGLDEARLTKLFQRIDKDSSNSLDQKEFVESFFPSAYSHLYGKLKLKGRCD